MASGSPPPEPQPQPWRFRNTYWLLRHGRSHTNEQDLIVSHPENGTDLRWGLNDAGRQQAAAAGAQLAAALASEPGYDAASQLLVLTSPFSRTVQTAELAAAPLGVQPGDARFQVRWRASLTWRVTRRLISWVWGVATLAAELSSHRLPQATTCKKQPVLATAQVEAALRERCFGAFEMTSCSNYEVVWAEDAASTANRCAGGALPVAKLGAGRAGSRCMETRQEERSVHPGSSIRTNLRCRSSCSSPSSCASPGCNPSAHGPSTPCPAAHCRSPGGGGESVHDVAERTRGLVQQLEAAHEGRHVVLVSHGDALSILAAALLGTPLGEHRRHGLPNCGVLRVA